MLLVAIPVLTLAVYFGVILLFLVMALYVGVKFQPLPADEIQALTDEVNRND